MLEDNGADRLLFEAMMRHDDFEKMTEQLDEFLESMQELPDIKADLDAYVEKLGRNAPSLEDAIDCIEGTEHAEFIKLVCEYLVLKKEDKVNAVMIYGAYSAGKTQFLNRLNEIFQLEYFMQTKGKFDVKYKTGRKAKHFVICEEGCHNAVFDASDQYHVCKLFLEG